MKEKTKPIIELLLRLKGIDISKYEDSFLHKCLQKRIAETQCATAETYYQMLEQSNTEANNFAQSLHIHYSEFFRNPLTFAVVEQIILPLLISKQKEIRIWSTACAAGQEAYSLAMLLEEFKLRYHKNIKYRIFATDQCQSQLIKAQKAEYSANEITNLNLNRLNQWFIKQQPINDKLLADTFTIKSELKENIDFSLFDLFSTELGCPPASIFGDFDIVLNANLLFYYKPKYRDEILQKTKNCLAKSGYVICGETEREILLKNKFCEMYPQSAIFLLNE